MDLISLKALLHQTLKLSPQQIQSMELLQMNSQELLEYLARVVEENPVLEQEDSHALNSAYSELKLKANWLDAGSSPSMYEGFHLFEGRRTLNAAVYVVSSLFLGVLGFMLGYGIARILF